MKNILIILGVLTIFASCNDDFLQRDPVTELAEGSFLTNESDLPYYLNSLYPKYVRGFETYWAYGRECNPWNNIQGARILMYDRASDNVVQQGNADSRLTGTYSVQASNSNTGWDWTNLRQVNYFLRKYTDALPSVDGDITKLYKYAAEAYFFKAWDYFEKVKIFGDVPWFTYDLNVDSEELYAPRTPRAEVMDSVLHCINFAIEHTLDAPKGGEPTGRINKDMANFLKARICLYEGSYRTYHTNLGLQSTASEWLQQCVDACEAIIATGNYSLYNSGTDPYWRLFTFNNSPKADGNTEAILAREYTGSSNYYGHATQRYWQMNRTRGSLGATRAFVDEYLCADGRPIYIGGSEGSWQENPLFEGYDGFWSELNNRDPRLRQTICRPGEFASVYEMSNGQTLDLQEPDKWYYPPVGYNGPTDAGIGTTVTGYWIIKWWMGDFEEYQATGKGTQTGLMFRYGEVLLMLAEAKAILGTITDEDIDRTINELRKRAGYDFATYPNAELKLSNIPDDPRLDAIYADKLDYSISPILREIRRERRVELFMEGQRYDDMMRWKAGKLYTIPMRGMKMTDEKLAFYARQDTKPPAVEVGSSIFLDEEGFLIAYPRTPGITQGTLPWDDKRYLWPISIQDMNENPNLEQTVGWR